jgi:hypothetical protein
MNSSNLAQNEPSHHRTSPDDLDSIAWKSVDGLGRAPDAGATDTAVKALSADE